MEVRKDLEPKIAIFAYLTVFVIHSSNCEKYHSFSISHFAEHIFYSFLILTFLFLYLKFIQMAYILLVTLPFKFLKKVLLKLFYLLLSSKYLKNKRLKDSSILKKYYEEWIGDLLELKVILKKQGKNKTQIYAQMGIQIASVLFFSIIIKTREMLSKIFKQQVD